MHTNNRAVIAISVVGAVLSIVLSNVWFNFSYFEPDTASYLFQAKLFASGRLCADAPPEQGFSPSPHINIMNGKWYSKYPFGNALMLTVGVFLNAPWLIPAIATGFSLCLLFLIAREAYGPQVAIVAGTIGLISPATLGMGCNWFSESVSRFYLAIYILGLIHTLKGNPAGRPIFPPLLSGFALGYAFNTRPMSAVAFGVAGAGLVIYWVMRSDAKVALLQRISLFFIPFAGMIGLCLAWNAYFTGNPLKFTHNAAQPYDRMGFGKRTEGYDPDLDTAFVFTPQWAVERIWRHTLPCISFNTLGWGYYRPELFCSHRSSVCSHRSCTDSVVAGIIAMSPSDRDWVTLRLWGHGDGTAQIQFQTKGDETAPGLTRNAPGFSCSGGRTDVTMRIVKNGDQYTGYFRTSPDSEWVQVGPTTIPLTPPLEVGVYSGVHTPAGQMRVSYKSFRVHSDAEASLQSDNFTGAFNEPWKWSGEPAHWEITRTGLDVQADTNSNQAARLYQTTSSNAFDIETRFAADWRTRERFLTLRVIPLAFPFILMMIPLLHLSRNRFDVFFLGCFLLTMAVYFFFYFEGSTWGDTPTHARYYTECTLLGIIPLTARGMVIVFRQMQKIRVKAMPAGVLLVGLILALLTVNTVHTYVLIGNAYQTPDNIYQKLPRLVKDHDVHHAVIFIPYIYCAPIGDYPFQSLEDADIVYFKLGPSRVWGLTNSNWRNVYKQYFKGRNAYVYDNGTLSRLDEKTVQ